MKDMNKTCKVAIVQAAPVLFDKEACLEKACKIMEFTTKNKQPDIIVFPELFIPGYPFGMNFGFSVGKRTQEGREDWAIYQENSIVIPGPETDRLCQKAKEIGCWISMGVSERDAVNGTLYNSNIMISPEGELQPVHRKIKPTGSERVVWGDANRGYFPVADTPWGPMGALICWESYMPLARVALYDKGVTLYISCNTNDNPEWQDTIKHIALEGRCYVINADLFFTKDTYPPGMNNQEELDKLDDIVCRGGSCIIDPYGHYVTEPAWDKETIVYAELDMDMVPASKMELDINGHYARPDILHFSYEDR